MRYLLPAALAFALAGCPSDTETDTDTDVDSDVDTGTDPDPDTDSDSFLDLTAECAAVRMDAGTRTSAAPCVSSDTFAIGSRHQVRADCTDPDITAVLDKAHVVLVPNTVTQDVLWVHLPGTGGEPVNAQNIGVAAVQAGYRFIGLAYPNENSVSRRCDCPDGPRPPSCEELVRYEVVTGEDVTPWFDMEADEAIVPRLAALLTWLHAQRPTDGWDAFLTDGGEVEWSRIALSGFSQGGGMAAMIARDHAVDRVAHFSVIAGATFEVLVDPSTATACTSDEECGDPGWCCPGDDRFCTEPPASDGVCFNLLPNPWIDHGADTDGDGVGDGTATDRATDLDRHFAYVHTGENAWGYTPVVTDRWGLGDASAYVDADTVTGPYGADVRLFRTSLPPNGAGCSEHQAMGPDACQPRDGTGEPAMKPAWVHAMTVDLDP